ncbi:MAG: putative ABC transporter permease [Lachnospiraceae bacterium]|nr:putative ABC transporter permease [Lachnospiraceae bacterium]
MKHLNIRSFDYYVLLFFCISFAGWLWEVVLYLLGSGVFVNRGVYYGPYLPIYGIGGLFLMLLLHAKRKQPLLVFAVSAAICTAIEYAAAAWLEYKWNVRWWDYSSLFMNLDGKICLLCSIGFGAGGVLLICIFQPFFNRLYHKTPRRVCILICIILIVLFTADAAYSSINPNTGRNITCFFAAIQ